MHTRHVVHVFAGLLVAARGAQRSACPAEGSAAKSVNGGTQTQVEFANDAGVSVSLRWVNTDGEELQIAELPKGDSHTMESYTGHVWRARDKASGSLLLEAFVKQGDDRHAFAIELCDGAPAAVDADDSEWLEVNGRRDELAAKGCPLDALVSKEVGGMMKGFHVMCAVPDSTGNMERLCIFKDGVDTPLCSLSVAIQGTATIGEAMHKVIARAAKQWAPKAKAPSPGMFTASGRMLPLGKTLAEVGVPAYRTGLVLILGGVWHWPPIREGFVRPLHGFVHAHGEQLGLKTLALRPRVFGVESFIADAECDRTLEVAGPKVAKSAVSVKDADKGKAVDTWRTSENTFMPSKGDPVLEGLDERVQNMTRIPISHSEHIQVLKYDINGRYLAHTDYFDVKDYQQDQGTLQMTAHGAWNRLLTVFMYMSDVPAGGQTYFPRYGGRRGHVPFDNCDMGYAVWPERRKVIIFYNMHPDGSPDPDSLHGGCKVKNGTKWSGNFWMWNVPQGFKSGKVAKTQASLLTSWDEVADRAEEQVVADFLKAPQKDEL